jgi:hypothetical protein
MTEYKHPPMRVKHEDEYYRLTLPHDPLPIADVYSSEGTARLFAHARQLAGALQWLLDDLVDASDDKNPETGETFVSVAYAQDVLQGALGLKATMDDVQKTAMEILTLLEDTHTPDVPDALSHAYTMAQRLVVQISVLPKECHCYEHQDATLIDNEELTANLSMIKTVAKRLYKEDRLTGDEMRYLAQKLHEGAVANFEGLMKSGGSHA